MLDGKYATILAGMSITDERDEVIDFTQPYIPPSRSVYVALAGEGDEAANGKVAAQVATIQASYLMSQTGVMLLEYKLASEPVEAVLSGAADAALVDREFAHESMAEYEGRLTIVGPEVRLDFGTGVGVREDDGPLKDKLDQALVLHGISPETPGLLRFGRPQAYVRCIFSPSRYFLDVDYRCNDEVLKRITYTITPYTTVIRLLGVVQNPANGFPARPLVLQRQFIWKGDFREQLEPNYVLP